MNKREKKNSEFEMCIVCKERPAQIKKRCLCFRCYQQIRNKGLHAESKQTTSQPTVIKSEHSAEILFIKNFFDHNNWVCQPATFNMGGYGSYRPDFYDGERNVFIEVVGSRQAFHFNREKYEAFKKSYPHLNFEIRLSNGHELTCENGRYQWGELLK